MTSINPGLQFRQALKQEHPLQIVGTVNACVALIAERAGYRALYLSGAGVANAAFGVPDVGITTLENVCEETKRIVGAVKLPLLVDIDTGWGDADAAVRAVELAGAAGVHLEDQVDDKRCGHLEGKRLASIEEMCVRIRAAVAAKKNPDFVVMARTDALGVEGMEATLQRVAAYHEAGADMFFAEAVTALTQYDQIKAVAQVPLLANITEFGKTPLFTVEELAEHQVDMVLYPLSAFRAMNKAAEAILFEIRSKGTQKGVLDLMQSRKELYDLLGYKPLG